MVLPRGPGSFQKTKKAFADLEQRATAAGWTYATQTRKSGSVEVPWVFDLNFPSGSGHRPIRMRTTQAVLRMLDQQFESYRLSAKYQALIDTQSGEVESAISTRAVNTMSTRRTPWDLPGIEITDDSPLTPDAETEDATSPKGWRLVVADAEVTIELSPASPMFEATFPYHGDVTVKVKHRDGPRGPRADILLEEFVAHFLIELELQHGLGAELRRRTPERPAGIGVTASDVPPRFPQLRYSTEAMSFYWYGAKAFGMPLLQYLAFYQVLEFYFSAFTRRAVVERLRSQIKDPRFDLRNDTAIDGLIEATRAAHAGLKRELDQLRHTLEDCVTPEALRDFIRSNEQLSAHLLAPKSAIRGTSALRLDADDDELIRDVAERVYRVRNRIVHTKAGGEEVGVELLLPTSEESNSMWLEIELVRWLAKRALVHGASTR
ncbi:hypothetical protein ABC195_15065 [Microbacterium sp. 2P01SA-2]|uniref:hypothetical protein n=1 Tax=unclassified Microbacterium TaxID=2609290 RepID=UPI0039A2C55F